MSEPVNVYIGIPSHNGEMCVESAASAYARVTDRRVGMVANVTTRTHTSTCPCESVARKGPSTIKRSRSMPK